jgi:hypothetical protein
VREEGKRREITVVLQIREMGQEWEKLENT